MSAATLILIAWPVSLLVAFGIGYVAGLTSHGALWRWPAFPDVPKPPPPPPTFDQWQMDKRLEALRRDLAGGVSLTEAAAKRGWPADVRRMRGDWPI